MKKNRIIVIIALLTALLLCMETAVVSGASLGEIRNKIDQKQGELEEGKEKEESLASQATQLEKSIGEGEAQLEVLKEELAAAEAKVETQNENLNARLRNMYKSGSVGFLDVLLDSGSFSEFLTNLDLVEKIYSSDQTVLKELEAAYDEVETKKTEVETLQAELKEQKAQVDKQKAEIAASNEETEKMLKELEAESQRMTQYIINNGSSSSNSVYTGGQMGWPVPSSSNITSNFGWRKDPVTGSFSRLHAGIDIGCGYGVAIVAANPGTVIQAGWNGGYGYSVTIDHGGGITTLYGHNSSVLVSRGQSVSRGQQIARAGSTGNSTGNHCHFEVRINGNPVDPLPYLR